jgi:hypothetical protein
MAFSSPANYNAQNVFLKTPMKTKTTSATITQLAAALAALEAYEGENTEAEHAEEAKRLGGGQEYYRMRLANALLGIAETEAMHSETAGGSMEQLFAAHRQALESAGATRTNETLLQFLQWRTLRIAGPLRQIAQDPSTGPIPLAAAHAAEALQRLLQIAATGQSLDPDMISPDVIKQDLSNTRESLTHAIANLDIMMGLITEAEKHFRST